jgi:exopolysaccharide biosynthesis predicted pyruvyltransferase EpsI
LSLLKSLNSKPFIFIEPGGNSGDHLIYKGAYKLADLAQLQYRNTNFDTIKIKDISNSDVIYVHGAGGFNPFCSGKAFTELSTALTRKNGITIVGPSTVMDDRKFLRENFAPLFEPQEGREVFFFTRELKSYEILKNFLPNWIKLEHDHDTALNLTKNNVYQNPLKNCYSLYAIRVDKESCDFQKSSPFLLWEDPIKLTNSFEEWVALHARARKIITNRTHSAILGAVLGKPVTMLANKYHKNQSIWEYSLSNRGVKWADKIETSKLTESLLKTKTYPKICQSYKLRQFSRWRSGFSTKI